MNQRELNTILVALRILQQHCILRPELEAIATNDGADARMDDEEIDALCERLNTPPTVARVLVTVSGGVADVLHGDEVVSAIVDYDDIKLGDGPVLLSRDWLPFFQTVLSKAQRDEFKGCVEFAPRGVGEGQYGME